MTSYSIYIVDDEAVARNRFFIDDIEQDSWSGEVDWCFWISGFRA